MIFGKDRETQAGIVALRISKLRCGSYFQASEEPRRLLPSTPFQSSSEECRAHQI